MPNQFLPVVELSSLNGMNGFKINGAALNDHSGTSVNSAGDVNGDGIDDFLINANTPGIGCGYVIFGRSNGWNSTLELSVLDGSNGFKLKGAFNDQGASVSGVRDINGDGIDDLLIGFRSASPPGRTFAGRSYVVFGKHGGWDSVVNLASINGTNGFKIEGEFAGDESGHSVSAAGDLNDDGINDIVIGAPYADSFNQTDTGCSYVIFGQIGIGSSGFFNLTNLNGANGFKLNGENVNDHSGQFVSPAGDVNNDGITDLLIGAPNASPNNQAFAGRSYIVFGRSGIGGNGTLNLGTLNGTNGVVINGQVFDNSGRLGTTVGDLNGDEIADLLIGAPPVNSQTGRSHVVFGKVGIGSSGVINLATLNGTNGIKLEGENALDRSGSSVSWIGDFNGDGIDDLLIGAPDADPSGRNGAGRSYVVFGKQNSWNSTLQLSNLAGFYGFKLNGEIAGDQSGISASGVGDINGDGVSDIVIGAPYADPLGRFEAGCSYIIFGEKAFISLWNNRLTISQGQTQIISSSNFNATSAQWVPNSLSFQITNLVQGRFESVYNPTVPISSFSQLQIKNGEIVFVHAGNLQPPSYDVTVTTPGFTINGPNPATIVFNRKPILITNRLVIQEGQTVRLTSANLNATDSDNDPNDLVFLVNNVQRGQFRYVNSTQIINQFSQNNVTNQVIEFVQDGTPIVPSYSVVVSDGQVTNGLPQVAQVTFSTVNDPPVLINNRLTINQGQTIIFSSADLSAGDEETSPPNLIFTVSAIQHGHFELTNNPGISVASFLQQEIMGNAVRFIADGSVIAPSYQISVSDGVVATAPQFALINFFSFNSPPVIINNRLALQEDETVRLTSFDLSATDIDGDSNELVFLVNNLQHGQFRYTNTTKSITHFAQRNITDSVVEFVHDGTNNAPGYSIAASDSKSFTTFQNANISFRAVNDPPVFVNNRLTVLQGQIVVVRGADLRATDEETTANNLTFTASAIQHGRFVSILNPANATTMFSQQEVINNQIRFVHDGGALAPVYNMSVSDGQVIAGPQTATISFTEALQPSVSTSQQSQVATAIGIGITGGILLAGMGGYLYCKNRAQRDLNHILDGADTLNKAAEFRRQILTPIAKQIFDRIKLPGFLSYTATKTIGQYVTAIQSVLDELQKLGADLDLIKLSPQHQELLLVELVKQIQQQTITSRNNNQAASFCRFFKSEISPIQIEDKAQVIAAEVYKVISSVEERRKRTLSSTSAPTVELEEFRSFPKLVS